MAECELGKKLKCALENCDMNKLCWFLFIIKHLKPALGKTITVI